MQMVDLEDSVSAFVAHRMKRIETPGKLIEEIDSQPDPAPPCPRGRLNISVRSNPVGQQTLILNQQNGMTTLGGGGVRIGTSPALPLKPGMYPNQSLQLLHFVLPSRLLFYYYICLTIAATGQKSSVGAQLLARPTIRLPSSSSEPQVNL